MNMFIQHYFNTGTMTYNLSKIYSSNTVEY